MTDNIMHNAAFSLSILSTLHLFSRSRHARRTLTWQRYYQTPFLSAGHAYALSLFTLFSFRIQQGPRTYRVYIGAVGREQPKRRTLPNDGLFIYANCCRRNFWPTQNFRREMYAQVSSFFSPIRAHCTVIQCAQ